jgi:alkanesulfonate monooxygenase SsuD/methylene tetrahydromethanopterin reductase-like flavin-dependent oxidoreductase (luciferase family)
VKQWALPASFALIILGVGAGWQEREHTHFGFDLGDMATRMARFEEAMEVITRLLRDEEPVTLTGSFYQLHEARLLPRPQRAGGPTILIGGRGPRRTLPLAARYAGIWNAGFMTPAEFHERSVLLDQLLEEAGRPPSSVRRTMMTSLHFGRTREQLERSLDSWRFRNAAWAALPPQELLQRVQEQGTTIVGTPEMAIEQIRRYAEAGVEELMLHWSDMDDMEGLRAFAEEVLPHV